MTIFKSLAVDSSPSTTQQEQKDFSHNWYVMSHSTPLRPRFIIGVYSIYQQRDVPWWWMKQQIISQYNMKSSATLSWRVIIRKCQNCFMCTAHTYHRGSHVRATLMSDNYLSPTANSHEIWRMEYVFCLCRVWFLLFAICCTLTLLNKADEAWNWDENSIYSSFFSCVCVMLFALIYSSISGSLSLSSTWWIDTRHEDFKLISITQRKSAAHSYRDLRSFTSSLWINSSIKPLLDWFRCHVKFDRTRASEQSGKRASRGETVQPVIKQPSFSQSVRPGRVKINREREVEEKYQSITSYWM